MGIWNSFRIIYWIYLYINPFFKYRNIIPSTGKIRGSILAAVLGMIALASFVVLAFMQEATDRIKYSGLFQNRDELRVEAYSLLDATIAVISEIQEIDGALYSPNQGWNDPLGYAQIEVNNDLKIEINIEDETGKISLSQANPLILNTLFEEMGILLPDAEILTDSLLDWIDSDDLTRLNGAELDFYERLDPPYKPADSSLKTWDELFLIQDFDLYFLNDDGIPNYLFDQFKSAISLYHTELVNLNTANSLVHKVISRVDGYDSGILYEFLQGEDRLPGTEDDQLISSRSHPYYPSAINTGLSMANIFAHVLKVTISVSRGDSNFLLSAIISKHNTSLSSENNREEELKNPEGNYLDNLTDQTNNTNLTLEYPFEIILLTENQRI